jgi:hypothetical protein
VWKEVTTTTIEMNAGIGRCREGEVRWKLGNNSALAAQSISMVKKKTL